MSVKHAVFRVQRGGLKQSAIEHTLPTPSDYEVGTVMRCAECRRQFELITIHDEHLSGAEWREVAK